MLNCRLTFDQLQLQLDQYSQAVNVAIQSQMKEALRAFLRAALTRIPVYSGDAQRSLLPIGRFVDENIPIDPVPGAHGHIKPPGEPLFKFSNDFLHPKITFSPNLLHFKINEFYDVSSSIPLKSEVPWHALEAGRRAYREYLRANLRKAVPSIKKFIVRTRVTHE